MQRYEYKVLPAPTRGEKVRGAKTGPDRFAAALSGLMNAQAREGWDYVRADTLPCEERTGFTGRTTVYHNMLVFRRALATATASPADEMPASPALLTAQTPFGEAPRITLSEPGTAPRLGPATGSPERDVAAE
jgi:hypothetical protein